MDNVIKEYLKCTIWAIVVFVCLFGIGGLFVGCKNVEYVPVESSHTEHHWHTDSVIQRDSVVKESMTTVMQLDSAEMAKYGIQLKNAERAWLVKSWELERQIEALQRLTAERDTVHDSIPVPYPVEKRLTKWQQAAIDWGHWIMALLVGIIVGLVIYYPRRNTGSK
jgi:hypothetical protein